MENPRIKASVVEANEFPEISDFYQVSAVPMTVIDGKKEIRFTGKYPEAKFIEELLKSLS